MAQIITRSTSGIGATVKNFPLTMSELDQNLIAINNDVYTDNYPSIYPTLNLDFVNTTTLDPLINFTRGSPATQFNSSGVLTTVGNNTPRLDYNPVTLAPQGLLIEESRTNSIRNNTMVGAVAGTPGTPPNHWSYFNPLGLSTQVVVTGVLNGINYVDIRVFGTAGSNNILSINLDSSVFISASLGQTWTASAWSALVGGTTNNITSVQIRSSERSAVDELGQTGTNLSLSNTLTRASATRTFTAAGTIYVLPYIVFTITTGAVDITLRIGMPQLEQGAFATSVIPTTTAAVTRNADVAMVNNINPWYNATEGTIYAEATGPIANIYRILAEGATASDFRDFSLAFDGLRGNFAARYVAGNFDVLGPTNSLTAGATVKLAGSYSATSADMAYNGVLAVSKNAITQRIPADRMFLGSRLGSSLQLNGYLRRITYYPRRLPNEQLQALTGS